MGLPLEGNKKSTFRQHAEHAGVDPVEPPSCENFVNQGII